MKNIIELQKRKLRLASQALSDEGPETRPSYLEVRYSNSLFLSQALISITGLEVVVEMKCDRDNERGTILAQLDYVMSCYYGSAKSSELVILKTILFSVDQRRHGVGPAIVVSPTTKD